VASHGQYFLSLGRWRMTRLKIIPDLLSILTGFIGRKVVFTLRNDTQIGGDLVGLNKDIALVVDRCFGAEVRHYVILSNVAAVSIEMKVADEKASGTEGGEKEG
jgi:small nuclear ribonucleoprotein (snRNP)-like protein